MEAVRESVGKQTCGEAALGRLEGPSKKYGFFNCVNRAPGAPEAPGRCLEAIVDLPGASRGPSGPDANHIIKPRNLNVSIKRSRELLSLCRPVSPHFSKLTYMLGSQTRCQNACV